MSHVVNTFYNRSFFLQSRGLVYRARLYEKSGGDHNRRSGSWFYPLFTFTIFIIDILEPISKADKRRFTVI